MSFSLWRAGEMLYLAGFRDGALLASVALVVAYLLFHGPRGGNR